MSRNTHNRQLDHHGTDLAGNIVLGAGTQTYTAGSSLQSVISDLDNRIYVAATSWKAPCRVATTGNVDLATGLASGQVIDGVTLATGDRVLVRAQTAATENGIYVAPASGAASRATDADTGQKLAGAATFVREGSTLGDTVWVVTTNGSIAIGTTAITWGRVVPAAGSSTTTSAPGDTTSQGTATEYARSDHVHGRESFATTTELADVGSTESAGTSGTVPRGDHVHRLGIATTKGDLLAHDGTNVVRLGVGTNGQVLTADSAQATGLAWTTPATPPSPGTGTTSSAPGDATAHGTSSDYARTDHKHGREGWGTSASSSAPGDAASAGTATTVARSDHKHGREAFGGAGAAHTGLAGSSGSASTVSRGDHAHPAQISLTASATDYVARGQVSGDTDYRLVVNADGTMKWGPGNATQDVSLYRVAAGRLGTDWLSSIRSTATDFSFSAHVTGDVSVRLLIYADGKMEWGPGNAARDTNLYRSAASTLRTDDSLSVGGSLTVGSSISASGTITASGTLYAASGTLQVSKSGTDSLIYFPPQTNDPGRIIHTETSDTAGLLLSPSDNRGSADYIAFGSHPSSTWSEALRVRTDGVLEWSGTALERDVNLYRSIANRLKTDDEFEVGRTNTSDVAYIVRRGSDTAAAFVIYGDGKIEWGPGGSSARDVNLYRGGANILRTDDTLYLGNYPNPNASALGLGFLELRGSTPYIDFANDAAADFDARLWLYDNSQLRVSAANLAVVDGWSLGARRGAALAKTTQSIAHNTQVKLTGWSTSWVGVDVSYNSTNSSLVVAGAGLYLIWLEVDLPARSDYSRVILEIAVAANNGDPTTVQPVDEWTVSPHNGGLNHARHYKAIWVRALNANDAVAFHLFQTNGAAAAVTMDSARAGLVALNL